MSDDCDSRVVAKLVLLQEACCDDRLTAADHGTLAVILDCCYQSERCFIGPTSIARITKFDEKTCRRSLANLASAGYLRIEARSPRSNWLYPNFAHAERVGCVVVWDGRRPLKVNRPFNPKAESAGTGARSKRLKGKRKAGTHVRNFRLTQSETADIEPANSGHRDTRQRAPVPDEAVESIEPIVARGARSSSTDEKPQPKPLSPAAAQAMAEARAMFGEDFLGDLAA